MLLAAAMHAELPACLAGAYPHPCPAPSSNFAERKQCIVCRAPVDETRVMDVSQLPPEAAGRQFVPPPSPPGQQGSGDKKSGGGSDAGGGAPHIELRAFAGSSAAAAAGSAAGQPAVPATPGADYLPDYLGPSPRAAGPAGPAPFVAVQVDGTPPPPLAGQPPQPLRTITVVRPQHWARRLLLFGMLLTLLAVITAIPIILARGGERKKQGAGVMCGTRTHVSAAGGASSCALAAACWEPGIAAWHTAVCCSWHRLPSCLWQAALLSTNCWHWVPPPCLQAVVRTAGRRQRKRARSASRKASSARWHATRTCWPG